MYSERLKTYPDEKWPLRQVIQWVRNNIARNQNLLKILCAQFEQDKRKDTSKDLKVFDGIAQRAYYLMDNWALQGCLAARGVSVVCREYPESARLTAGTLGLFDNATGTIELYRRYGRDHNGFQNPHSLYCTLVHELAHAILYNLSNERQGMDYIPGLPERHSPRYHPRAFWELHRDLLMPMSHATGGAWCEDLKEVEAFLKGDVNFRLDLTCSSMIDWTYPRTHGYPYYGLRPKLLDEKAEKLEVKAKKVIKATKLIIKATRVFKFAIKIKATRAIKFEKLKTEAKKQLIQVYQLGTKAKRVIEVHKLKTKAKKVIHFLGFLLRIVYFVLLAYDVALVVDLFYWWGWSGLLRLDILALAFAVVLSGSSGDKMALRWFTVAIPCTYMYLMDN